jgi:hypothetical protein
VIKPGTSAEVGELVASLAGADGPRREAAIARLTIIGARAVARLIAEYDATTDRRTRVAILRVLEGVPDERALGLARREVKAGADIAVAAVAVLRTVLDGGTSAAQTEAFEALLDIASNAAMERRTRAEAAAALKAVEGDILAAVNGMLPPLTSAEEALWQDALDGVLTDDPASLRHALRTHGERAPLPSLRRMIDRIRDRERGSGNPALAAGWCELRGAVHQALAFRQSRVALYDLRETIAAAAEPLPPSFLGALQAVGDESCLEGIAAAHVRAPAGQERWRYQLARTFQAIARRERLTRRHAAVRRALARAPELGRPA